LIVLQSGAGVIEVIGLEVTAAVSPHKLIIQLLDTRLKVDVLMKELSVALLNVLDCTVLGLHLANILLQAEAQVSARCYDLLKQGAHMPEVACRERPTRMVGRKHTVTNSGHALTPHHVALVSNGEQGNGGVTEDWQVVLIELREGLVGSPLQSVIEVVASNRGKPSHHSRVSGVSQNVHMDHTAPQPKLTVQTTTVCRNPRVA
jgi:hypothetical protein